MYMYFLKFKKITLPFFVILTANITISKNSFAYEVDPCSEREITLNNNFKLQIRPAIRGSNECLVYLASPKNIPQLTTPSMSWSTNGRYMINYLFEGKSNSLNTGAKSYYFSPHRNPLQVHLIGQNEFIEVTMVNGIKMVFNTYTGLFDSITNTQYAQNSTYNRNNPNWLEIQSTNEFIFELDYTLGKSPRSDRYAVNHLLSPYGSCRIYNNKLFDYTSSDEIEIKVITSNDLQFFLSKNCPSLQTQLAQSK